MERDETRLSKVKPRTLGGFMELLPQDQILFNQMQDKIRASYERHGYLPLDTPILEASEILLAKTQGETNKQIFEIEKENSAMRFDLTVPLAKYVALHSNELSFPFKRYQIGKVYRGERQQAGRFREFYQADIDVIGNEKLDLMYDAEAPSVINKTFTELDVGEFAIHMNNRRIPNGLIQSLGIEQSPMDILHILDRIDKDGQAETAKQLKDIGLNTNQIDKLLEFMEIKGTNQEVLHKLKTLKIKSDEFETGVTDLEKVANGVNLSGVPEKNLILDTKITRGLDYYTGTVYETFLKGRENIGSVCSGGRYDDLAKFYTEKKMPGVGISIGLTRLFDQLNKAGAIKADKQSISDIIVIPATDRIGECIKIAEQLREAGLNTEVLFENKKIGQKFAYAERLNIPKALIVGDNEIKVGKYGLKDMKTRTQQELTIEEIVVQLTSNKVSEDTRTL
jgi:histidyl-tRNA synthetase